MSFSFAVLPTSYLPSGLLQLSTVPHCRSPVHLERVEVRLRREVSWIILAHVVEKHQAPTQVDVCKASTDTVVSHKLSRNAGSPSRRTNGSLPDPGCWRAVRLLNSDSFGTCIPWCNQSNFPPDQPESRLFGVLVASVCAEPSERMEVEQRCVAREVEANVR